MKNDFQLNVSPYHSTMSVTQLACLLAELDVQSYSLAGIWFLFRTKKSIIIGTFIIRLLFHLEEKQRRGKSSRVESRKKKSWTIKMSYIYPIYLNLLWLISGLLQMVN